MEGALGGGLRSYFSFHGRSPRKRYWLILLGLFASIIAFVVLLEPLLTVFLPRFVTMVPVLAAALWLHLANTARRLHDRGKSAWWVIVFVGCPVVSGTLREMMLVAGAQADGPGSLLALISSAFSLWALIELGFMKGTVGSNRFGEDPLSPIGEVFA